MDYIFEATGVEDIGVVFPNYYEYFTRIYGESLFSNMCRRAVTSGNFASRALPIVDEAYGRTKEAITASNHDGTKIIAMRTAEGVTVGFFRLRFIDVEDARVACIAELVLANERTNNRIEELKDLVGDIEAEIMLNCPDVHALDFESGAYDGELQIVLAEADFYPIENDPTGQSRTFMYEKQLRKQKSTRE